MISDELGGVVETVYLDSDPACWGDCTMEEAVLFNNRLKELIEAQFDECEVIFMHGAQRCLNSDHINELIDHFWVEAMEGVLMDIDEVSKKNLDYLNSLLGKSGIGISYVNGDYFLSRDDRNDGHFVAKVQQKYVLDLCNAIRYAYENGLEEGAYNN